MGGECLEVVVGLSLVEALKGKGWWRGEEGGGLFLGRWLGGGRGEEGDKVSSEIRWQTCRGRTSEKQRDELA